MVPSKDSFGIIFFIERKEKMKENDLVILKLRDELESVYIDLYRYKQKNPEKFAGEIERLNEIAKEIKHRIALRKTELATERAAKKGR